MANYIKSAVLVFDGNQRSSLAVTRSLGKIDNTTIIVTDSGESALAGSSRYCALYLKCPSPQDYPAQFIDWVKNAIFEHGITHLFPCTEITSQTLLMNQEALPNCILPFPSIDTLQSIANKHRLLELADKLNIPYPKSIYYKNVDEVNLNTNFQFPLVIKPSVSNLWIGDRWINSAVSVARDIEDLKAQLKDEYFSHGDFMLQEFVPGHGAGVFLLYNKGEYVAQFSHKRINEKPPSGGVSTISESVIPEANLLSMSKQLLSEAKWHGVAMIEYKMDGSSRAMLMEVNTRFWGTLQLAIDAGVDFPRLLWEISDNPPKPSIPVTYKVGIRLRWVLGDIDSFYLYLRSNKYSLTQKLKRTLTFLTPSLWRTRHEINRLDDIKPALYELKIWLKDLIR